MSETFANRTGADFCTISGGTSHHIDPVMQKARGVWSLKTAEHLSEITGYSLRSCKAWLSGETKPPSDAIYSLICTDEGLQFIAAIVGKKRPRWWHESREKQAEAADTIQHALESQDELRKALLRAASALCVQDADFGGPFVDGIRAMARLPRRAVVAPAYSAAAAAASAPSSVLK